MAACLITQVDAAHQAAREGGEAARQQERALQAEINGLRTEVNVRVCMHIPANVCVCMRRWDWAQAGGRTAAHQHAWVAMGRC